MEHTYHRCQRSATRAISKQANKQASRKRRRREILLNPNPIFFPCFPSQSLSVSLPICKTTLFVRHSNTRTNTLANPNENTRSQNPVSKKRERQETLIKKNPHPPSHTPLLVRPWNSSHLNSRPKQPPPPPNPNLKNPLFTSSPQRPPIPTHSQARRPHPHLPSRDAPHAHSPQHSLVTIRKRREPRDGSCGVGAGGVSIWRLGVIRGEAAPAVALGDEGAGASGALGLEFGSDFGGGGARTGGGSCARGGFEQGAADEAHGVFYGAPGVGGGFGVCG